MLVYFPQNPTPIGVDGADLDLDLVIRFQSIDLTKFFVVIVTDDLAAVFHFHQYTI